MLMKMKTFFQEKKKKDCLDVFFCTFTLFYWFHVSELLNNFVHLHNEMKNVLIIIER